MEGFKKCKMCGIPLNREIQAQGNPELCFECAEEKRKFSMPENGQKKCSKCGADLNENNTSLHNPLFCKVCDNAPAAENKSSKGLKGFLSSLFK